MTILTQTETTTERAKATTIEEMVDREIKLLSTKSKANLNHKKAKEEVGEASSYRRDLMTSRPLATTHADRVKRLEESQICRDQNLRQSRNQLRCLR